MTKAMQTKRREFRMHKRLLWDVINKQAGTVEKSILEAVMNSIDAGATKIDITIDPEHFIITDDGKGFGNEKEIEDFFETFGYPHEEGDVRFGKYRMGRGQLFSFGKNLWISNENMMYVDLKPQEKSFKTSELGLGYDFTRLAIPQPGCRIEVTFYDPMLPRAYNNTLTELAEFVKYAEIPITLNGAQINIIPAKAQWTDETTDAYFNFRAGASTLKIYNLGVLVKRHAAGAFGGTGGDVVSKKRLDVNFARNDVVATCPVWRSIQATLRQHGGVERKRKSRLSDADRDALVIEILSGEMAWPDILDARVITDVTGAHRPIVTLSRSALYCNKIAAVPTGHRCGERALDAKLAFVLSDDTLGRFNAPTTQAFCKKLAAVIKVHNDELITYRHHDPEAGKYPPCDITSLYRNLQNFTHIDENELASYFSDTHETVEERFLTKYERLALTALNEASTALHRHLTVCWAWHGRPQHDDILTSFGSAARTIKIGESDTAMAWTNGSSNIWINRDQVDLLKGGESGWIRIVGILLHEYAHSDDDRTSHMHDADFFRKIERALTENNGVGKAVEAIRRTLYHAARKAKKSGYTYLTQADSHKTISDAGLSEADSSFAFE